MKKLFWLFLFNFCFFLSLQAHICDDVFRQKNKLVVKPEFQNLVIKDKGTFKIFLMNNMDRAIAGIKLQGKSNVFNIKISLKQMGVPQAKGDPSKKVHFTVEIEPKSKNIKAGRYPLYFRLVGYQRGREFKSFSVGTQLQSTVVKKIIEEKKATAYVVPIKKSQPPDMDGLLNDTCWKGGVAVSDFSCSSGGKAKERTLVFLRHDSQNLYLGTYCKDSSGPDSSRPDMVRSCQANTLYFYLGNPPENKCYRMDFPRGGEVKIHEFGIKDGLVSGSAKKVAVTVVKKEKSPPGEAKFWTVEAAIPLKAIGIKDISQAQLSLNVVRSNNIVRKSAQISLEEKEIHFWKGNRRNYLQISQFGQLSFGE